MSESEKTKNTHLGGNPLDVFILVGVVTNKFLGQTQESFFLWFSGQQVQTKRFLRCIFE